MYSNKALTRLSVLSNRVSFCDPAVIKTQINTYGSSRTNYHQATIRPIFFGDGGVLYILDAHAAWGGDADVSECR